MNQPDSNMCRILGDEGTEAYDQLVAATPSSMFQTFGWHRLMAEVTGPARAGVIGLFKGEEMIGGCPLFEVDTEQGPALRCPLVTQYNGPVLRERPSKQRHRREFEVWDRLEDLRRFIEANYIEARLITHPEMIDVRLFQWAGWRAQVRYTYRYDLHDTDMSRASADVRRRARQAKESGLEARRDLGPDTFYGLWAETHQRQGMPVPLSADHLTRLFDALGDRLVTILVTRDKKPLAGLVTLVDGKTAYLWMMAGASPEALSTGANMFGFAELVRELHSRCRTLDLCGGDTPTIARYKATLGAELTPHVMVWWRRHD